LGAKKGSGLSTQDSTIFGITCKLMAKMIVNKVINAAKQSVSDEAEADAELL